MKKFIALILALDFFSLKIAHAQQSFQLNIKQPPPLTIAVSDGINATVGQLVNLDSLVHVAGDISFDSKWKFWDGSQLQTVTNPVFTVISKGVFYVTVTNENGCTALDSITINVATGIHPDQDNQQFIRVYPNPNTGEFDVLISDCQPGFSIQIINSPGVQLLNRVLDCNKNKYLGKIAIPDVKPGIYYLLVKKDGLTVYQQKVVMLNK